MRPIDADALKNRIDVIINSMIDGDETETEMKFFNMINHVLHTSVDETPTIEAEPVRHGVWVDKFGNGDLYCSECGAVMEKHEHINHNLYYCYHCGAKMN